jgi:hypothetical protein
VPKYMDRKECMKKKREKQKIEIKQEEKETIEYRNGRKYKKRKDKN